MNTTQRTILALGLLVAAIQCAVPPKQSDHPAFPVAYEAVWEQNPRWVDWPRLAAQLLATGLAAAGAAALAGGSAVRPALHHLPQ